MGRDKMNNTRLPPCASGMTGEKGLLCVCHPITTTGFTFFTRLHSHSFPLNPSPPLSIPTSSPPGYAPSDCPSHLYRPSLLLSLYPGELQGRSPDVGGVVGHGTRRGSNPARPRGRDSPVRPGCLRQYVPRRKDVRPDQDVAPLASPHQRRPEEVRGGGGGGGGGGLIIVLDLARVDYSNLLWGGQVAWPSPYP